MCKFNWIGSSSLPTLTDYSVAYSTSLSDYEITLTGTGFPTNTADVTFKIDGFAQTITSATSTQIKV
jgi:hypothetical protein